MLQYRLVPVDVNEDNGKRFGGGQFDHGGTLTARKDEHQHARRWFEPMIASGAKVVAVLPSSCVLVNAQADAQ